MTSGRISAVEAMPRLPLGEMMLQRGLISKDDLDRALEHQLQSGHQKLLGEVLQQFYHCFGKIAEPGKSESVFLRPVRDG